MIKVSKKKAIISVTLAAVFIICTFWGSIVLRHIKSTADEDPTMQETTTEMDIVDIQIVVMSGHTSYITIYATNDYTEKNGIVYAIYPDENTVFLDAQGNQADCFSLTIGQSIRVRALNVISYTGWLNPVTGESFLAEGLHFCSEIAIMD